MMENELKLRILRSIGKVFDTGMKSELDWQHISNAVSELRFLAEYFRVSESEAFFLAHIITLNYRGRIVNFDDLTTHFNCNPMRLLEYSHHLDSLVRKGILISERIRRRVDIAMINNEFVVHELVTQAILQGEPMPEITKPRMHTVFDVLEKVDRHARSLYQGDISSAILYDKVNTLLEENVQFPLIQRVRLLNLKPADTILYLLLIWENLSGSESLDLGRTVDYIFDNPGKRILFIQATVRGFNRLVRKNLVEVIEADFVNNTNIRLSQASHEVLRNEGIVLYSAKSKRKDVMYPADIPVKKLYFSQGMNRQLNLLGKLLDKKKFRELQSRLSTRKMVKGITVLFHGYPGTGKTESVYQLARRTKREIIQVDISQTKSMWFGESERKIKAIFTNYRAYAAQSSVTPILLFNEADAILSKRVQGASSVNQTENTIQNIILDELERFEGIFFATTNLPNHFDAAFERRFLFKIEFEKPGLDIQTRIWKSKLKDLKEDDYRLLAGKYTFSGGQIDNIARKCEVYGIVKGKIPPLKQVLQFCEEEELYKDRKRPVGFLKKKDCV